MKTTQRHFEVFKKECLKWIKRFGLQDWRVDFFHEDWSDSYGQAKAWCKWNVNGRVVSFCLASEWNIPIKAKDVQQTAFHEVGHLLLGRIDILAGTRYLCEDEIKEEVHAIIRRLENAVFRKEM